MIKKITVQQKFNRPVADVFDLLSKHDTYNQMFYPIQVVRVKDATDAQRPDGLGSIRRMGLGPIKPLQEEITTLQENALIEYKLINNPLVKHHLGRLVFKVISPDVTQVTYTIEFQGKVPLSGLLVLSQLKLVVSMGMAKLAKRMR